MLPCSEHGHYHHGSQQSNYAHSQHHPHPDANPTPRPRCSIMDLGELTSASLKPIREQCVASLLEYGIGCVTLGVAMGGIDEKPQGRDGTARLQLNPEPAFQQHFVRTFLSTGSAAMVEPMPPAMYSSVIFQGSL